MKKIIPIFLAVGIAISCCVFVPMKKAKASTSSTVEWLYTLQAQYQNTVASVVGAGDQNEAYNDYFELAPSRLVGKYTGENMGKLNSSYGFAQSVLSTPIYKGTVSLSYPSSLLNTPYYWFQVFPKVDSTIPYNADFLFISDKMTSGKYKTRVFVFYSQNGKTWCVSASDGQEHDTASDVSSLYSTYKSLFNDGTDVTSNMNDFLTYFMVAGCSVDSFLCHDNTNKLSTVFSLYPERGIVSRQFTFFYNYKIMQFRFLDWGYNDGYYSSSLMRSFYSALTDSITAKYERISGEVSSVRSDYNKVLSDYNSLKQQYDFYRNQAETLTAQVDSLTYQVSALQSSLSDLTVERDDWKKKYDTIFTQYSVLTSKYNSLQSTYSALQTDYSNLEQDFDGLQKSYNTLQSSKMALESQVEALKAKFNEQAQVSYSDGYAQGKADGRSEGLAEAAEIDFSFSTLLWNIIDAPVRIISEVLNFDIFGVNLAALVKFIVSTLLVAFVVRRFI